MSRKPPPVESPRVTASAAQSSAKRGPLGERSSAAALSPSIKGDVRDLVIVLGDQLDPASAALKTFDSSRDAILMMEVRDESLHVPSHVQRTALFLSAMRHFALDRIDEGARVRYIRLDDPANTHTLAGEVARAVSSLRPQRIVMLRPGDHRLTESCRSWGAPTPVNIVEDTHFLTTPSQYAAWASGRAKPIMEYFYREQRKRLGILMDYQDKPIGGAWNFDKENRLPFGKNGPGAVLPPVRFAPDAVTAEVQRLVATLLPGNPGSSASFGWPVTPEQAKVALDDFIDNRLAYFGPHEDAMWTGHPWLYHSQLSAPLNLKLISPQACIDAALAAAQHATIPLTSLEGFIRQIIGWREFIRGVYDHQGPNYATRNGLRQYGRLPSFYWTGNVDMNCMRHCIGHVVEHAYAHHIQRLMVMGNWSLIAGVHPIEISDWFLAMFVDGVDWVTLPNTLGMVMHADATPTTSPVVGTKPYAASGQYISRMSNYCKGCRFDPSKRTGDDACPFTTFYWDFMSRQRPYLEKNPRTATLIKNLDRWGTDHMTQITISAQSLRERYAVGDIRTPRTSTRTYTWDDAQTPAAPHNAAKELFS